MDNVCHTLVGAALGEAGLKTRTRYGNLTLMIAANIPDVDVLVFATDTPSVSFRRGWTHGVAAQAILPLVLAAVVFLIARSRRTRGNELAPGGPGVHFGWLLALAYLGTYSHVFLDYLNNYGVRLLAPVDWRWFYGDAVFIIDIWLWLALGGGVWLARRSGRTTPARAALVFAASYVFAMLASTAAARNAVANAWFEVGGTAPRAMMVGPLPVTPFSRQVIIDAGSYYQAGLFSWTDGTMSLSREQIPKNDGIPEVQHARDDPRVSGFLVWSRFPYWEVVPFDGGTRVTVRDMRFGDRFAASTIVPRTPQGSHP
jgi:inner membrane protein